jgi:hypothetical protein
MTAEFKPIAGVISTLNFYECAVEPCGSRVTCKPPPVDTDEDYLVEIVNSKNDPVSQVVAALHDFGFEWESGEHYQRAATDGFMSWRRVADNINLIVTANPVFAQRHRIATALCTRLNLMDKQDRIAVFQAVLYGAKWTGPKRPAAPPADEDKIEF